MTANEDTSDCRPATETQTSAKCIGTNERTTVGTAQQRALMVFSASSRFLSLLSFAELTSPSTVLFKTTCRSSSRKSQSYVLSGVLRCRRAHRSDERRQALQRRHNQVLVLVAQPSKVSTVSQTALLSNKQTVW